MVKPATRQLEISARALSDLAEIRGHIRQFDPAAASRVGQHLSLRIKRLTAYPELGAATSRPGFRILQPTRYPYRVYYAVLANSVRILHVRHTSRDLPSVDDL